ncbi:hypothetical protein ONZ51_g4192 [Trametes cubensis]|uniref:G1/S-specific cyclin pas1 n=2 Tax=Trametes TaxID=5324 RepID=A0AAD7XD89_9APHY|nr:hypothetical protein ONZ51_g4192 [Trametes cubensis]
MNFHAVSHSFPHRGPGASRARTRWQPYAPAISLANVPKSSSPAVYLHTPASSVASASPLSTHIYPLSDPERLRALPLAPQQSTANPLRDAQKTKYAAKLVDQAVKSLCDTWHPDDIPVVFTACGRESLCAQPEPTAPLHPDLLSAPSVMAAGISKLFAPRNTQLPSPVSPTSRPSPAPSVNGYESYSQAPESSESSNLIPIKGFVHEVLRRSRTSTGVLQTALCYLEAVRSKVPELLRKEKTRPASEYCAEDDAEPRIVLDLFDQDEHRDGGVNGTASDVPDKTAGPTLNTIRIDDTHYATVSDADMQSQYVPAASRSKQQGALPPLPPLPSPLCCPRRTFLACLILASKFMQDRSYSNRAWAKLAGLPPREIGRCERAVGEALEWRLWVGKIPAVSASSATSDATSGRAFARTRSDGDLLAASSSGTCTSSATAAWAAAATADADAQQWVSPPHAGLTGIPTPLPTPRHTRTIQRSATVPSIVPSGYTAARADAFLMSASRYDNTSGFFDASLAPGIASESAMDVESQSEVSPSLSTPTLSYSPMSSASSSSDGSEERTIQMSMFVDLPTPSPSYAMAGPSGSGSCSGGPWVASTSAYTPADPANPYCSTNHIKACNSYSAYYSNSHSMYLDATAAAGESVEETAAGPTLPAIDAKAKVRTTVLPSFAEAFALDSVGRCPGMLGYGTR